MKSIINFFKRIWAFIDFTPDKYKEWRTYEIKKGDHNSVLRIDRAYHSISFLVDLSGAWYDENKLGNDKYDWNKLYGLTTSRIHKNSWRIGWRIIDGKTEFAAYWYQDGVRYWSEIGKCSLNDLPMFTIEIKEDCVMTIFQCQGKRYSSGTMIWKRPRFVYRSFPYFGGNQPSPNDIKIKIKEL